MILKKKIKGLETKNISTTSSYDEVYCVKCKTKRQIQNPEEIIMSNGRTCN